MECGYVLCFYLLCCAVLCCDVLFDAVLICVAASTHNIIEGLCRVWLCMLFSFVLCWHYRVVVLCRVVLWCVVLCCRCHAHPVPLMFVLRSHETNSDPFRELLLTSWPTLS